LGGVCGAEALAKLTEVDRHEWHALWEEIEQLSQREAAAGPKDSASK